MTGDADPGSGRATLATETLEDFLDSLDLLNEAQLLGLAASFDSRDARAHEDAWTKAIACAAVSGLTVEMGQAREATLTWAMRGTPNAPWPDAGRMEDTCALIRRMAGPALAAAAVALVLGDRLDETTRILLMEHWLNAVEGSPEVEA